MSFKKGIPIPRYPMGPKCSGCPYRRTSFGFAPGVGPETAKYAFIAEALGKDEVAEGRPLVGGSGRVFNGLIRRNTQLRRSEEYVTNVVKCRPVVWKICPSCQGREEEKPDCQVCSGQGQVPAIRESTGDHINLSPPSPGQARECAERYLKDELTSFAGKYIIGLGQTALNYFGGGSHKISNYRGTLFEPGRLADCTKCGATGSISGKDKRCNLCRGKGITWDLAAVGCVGKHGGKKASKRCASCRERNTLTCTKCNGLCIVPGRSKACSGCKGAGRIPAEPNNPYVSDRLHDGQIFFPTYHPAWLMRNPNKFTIADADFKRLEGLDSEAETAKLGETGGAAYAYYPKDSLQRVQAASQLLSIDIEGPSAKTYEGDISVVGISGGVGSAYCLNAEDPSFRLALEMGKIIGQNYILYDAWVLLNRGFPFPQYVWDTRFAGHLLNPDTPHSLTYLAGEYAQPPVRGFWKSEYNYRENIQQLVCQDAEVTYRVYEGQKARLEREGLLGWMEKEVVPISLLSLKMRQEGIRIDTDRMAEAAGRIKNNLSTLRGQLPDWGGVRTENQNAKVQDFLFRNLKLPVISSRKTGKQTADEETLTELRNRLLTGHRSVLSLSSGEIGEGLSFIDLVLKCRELSKLESSFLRYRGPFVHPAWNPAGTGTFRYSCSDPNVQQVPDCDCKRRGRSSGPCGGRNSDCLGARYIFVPDYPDWELMSIDLKQAEVIGFLWYAEAWDALRQVLLGGLDAHAVVGDLTGLSREDAKTTTFAILYGEDYRTTAARLHRAENDIQAVRDQYFQLLPGVPEYRRQKVWEGKEKGYVTNPFGLRRYIRIDSDSLFGRAANQACNAPIQAIPPLVIRRAMLALDKELPKPARIWAQVHDELILTYPKGLRLKVLQIVREIFAQSIPEMPAAVLGMAGGLRFNIDVAVGPNWGGLGEVR